MWKTPETSIPAPEDDPDLTLTEIIEYYLEAPALTKEAMDKFEQRLSEQLLLEELSGPDS